MKKGKCCVEERKRESRDKRKWRTHRGKNKKKRRKKSVTPRRK